MNINQGGKTLDKNIANIAKSILELQEAANGQIKPSEYKELAFDILSRNVACETGIWAEGRVEADRIGRVHDCYLYRLPPEFLVSYANACSESAPDELLNRVVSEPGITHDLREIASAEFFTSRVFTEHCQAWGINHALNSAVYWDQLNLFTSIAIYRSDIEKPFSAADKAFKQAFTPNMVEGLRTCLRNALMDSEAEFTLPENAIALVDKTGLVHHVSAKFSDLFWNEVASKHSISMYEFSRDILAGVAETADLITQTRHVSFGLIVIRLVKVPNWGQLSARQKTVAQMLATNAEYVAIAEKLHIARSTVTNHANEIYRILKIKNKFELSSLIRGYSH